MKKVFLLAAFLLSVLYAGAQDTYQFAQRDTLALYMDIYDATPGSETTYQGLSKPTILFVFGGGFKIGDRSDDFYQEWFATLNNNGYAVVTIDYRLGMKDYVVGDGLANLIKSAERFHYSQQIAVEDVYSAVSFLAENREELGIDPYNLVVAGCSAGAITALAAEYDIVNGNAKGLPEGFNFRGVMSFAGAIISMNGAPRYRSKPCPTLLLHGTDDGAVAYDHTSFLGKGVWGSSYLVKKLEQAGADYCIYRYLDCTHDVACFMQTAWNLEKDFLEKSVIQGARYVVDATIDDSSLPTFLGDVSLNDIY